MLCTGTKNEEYVEAYHHCAMLRTILIKQLHKTLILALCEESVFHLAMSLSLNVTNLAKGFLKILATCEFEGTYSRTIAPF
jgi:phage terminase large subunit-like protein